MSKKIKVLNLYCGIGGNRRLWKNVEVTAVEINPEIAKIYQDFFPGDKVIVGDAHQYLLDHYKKFDFIWSSPPCPSHGVSRYWSSKSDNPGMNYPGPIYPDMKLYEEIIFLTHFFKGKWVVENVISYYEPLIKPFLFNSHYYWANFIIEGQERERRFISESKMSIYEKRFGFDIKKYKLKSVRKLTLMRNCVVPEHGKAIFDMAFKNKQLTLLEMGE